MAEVIGKGVNLHLRGRYKRLWFEVPKDEKSIQCFDSLGKLINQLRSDISWLEFLKAVEELYESHGFKQIAK